MATLRKQQQPGAMPPEEMQMGGGMGMGGANVRPRQPATMPAQRGASAPMPPGPGQTGPFQPMPQVPAGAMANPMMGPEATGVRPRGPAQGLAAVQGAMGGGANGGVAPDVLARLMQMLQSKGSTPGGF